MGVARKPSSKAKSTKTTSTKSSSSSASTSSASSKVISSTRVASSDSGKVSSGGSVASNSGGSGALPSLSGTNTASTPQKVSSQMAIGESRVAPSDTPLASTKAATTAPKTTTTKAGVAPTSDVKTTATVKPTAGVKSTAPSLSDPVASQIKMLENAIAISGDPTGARQKRLDKLRGTQTTTTTAPVTTTQPAAIQAEIDSIQNQQNNDINALDSLQTASVNAETEYKDTITELANQKLETEKENLARLEATQKEVLDLRTKAAESTAATERADAQAAYDKNLRDTEEQRLRTKQAYNQQIVETAVSNTKRVLEEENYIAATGGFGSLVKNNQMMELTLSNDRLLNSVKFEADAADREVSNSIIDITDTYTNNLKEIETTKQQNIDSAYSEYLQYVTEIQNDRELAEDERYDAIKTAQAEYKKNVAQINLDSFNSKYEVSQTAAEQVRALKFRQADSNLSSIYGYVVDSTGNAILDEYGQKIDVPEEAQSNLQYVAPTYDEYGRIRTQGGSFDPSTGVFTPDSSLGVPSYLRQNGGVNFSSPEVQSYLEDVFGVGSVGGWCGDYASTISTASKVGNTWAEKYDAIDSFDPQVGYKMVLPLGVTDANKSYGHVATVIGYNEATGDIYTVESNADGRQNKGQGQGVISLGTYNLYDLQAKYGDNFGFVSGELKEPYKSSVEGIPMSFGTSMYGTSSSSSDDIINISIEADQLGLTGNSKAKYITARSGGMSSADAVAEATASTTKTKLSAGQQEDLVTSKGLISMIDELNTYYDDASLEGVGGFYQGSFKNFIDKNLGWSSDEGRNVRQLVGNIKGTIAKLRGGTSFTANEQAMLETYVPTINDSQDVLMSKVANLKSFLQEKVDNTIAVAGGDYSTGSNSSSVVLPDYIQELVDSGAISMEEAIATYTNQ